MSSVALETPPGFWARLPVAPRAIVSGLLIGLGAANVWPILLIKLGMPLAAVAEAAFAPGHSAGRNGCGVSSPR
jgi:hypothetical protein